MKRIFLGLCGLLLLLALVPLRPPEPRAVRNPDGTYTMRFRLSRQKLPAFGLLRADQSSYYPPASADDGRVYGVKATWPPDSGEDANTGEAGTPLYYIYSSGNYYYYTVLYRFDTSGLPDNATVTSATLSFYLDNFTFPDGAANFKMQGEYYSSWPIGTEDYVAPGSLGSTAFLSSTADNWTSGAYNNFTLSNLGSISLTGYTGFRIGLVKPPSNGAPSGSNYAAIYFVDNIGTNKDPYLTVTYTVPSSTLKVVVVTQSQ